MLLVSIKFIVNQYLKKSFYSVRLIFGRRENIGKLLQFQIPHYNIHINQIFCFRRKTLKNGFFVL